MSCRQSFAGGGSQEPIWWPVGGKAIQGQGLGKGGAGRRCGQKSSCWVGGRGSALNRGPQLGFHNDISGEQAEPSDVQMGKLRRGLLQCLRREGPFISYSGLFIFPRGHGDLELERLVTGHSVFRLRHRSGRQLGHLAPEPPSTLEKPGEHPPPPQLLGGVLGSGACLPSPTHVPAKGSF